MLIWLAYFWLKQQKLTTLGWLCVLAQNYTIYDKESSFYNFFLFEESSFKVYFIDLGERVKSWLSHVFIRNAYPDSNSRSAV
jgi:hypothetical protein